MRALVWLACAAAGLACGRRGFETDASPDVPVANRVFVTSTTQLPTTFGADFSGADGICNARAVEAGLPGRYVAWLSELPTLAQDRLAGARGWIRVDDRPVADRVEDLIAGRLFHPIRIDEHGDDIGSVGADVATATTHSGGPSADCTGYAISGDVVLSGRPWYTTYGWTEFEDLPCTTRVRLYCFGIDLANPVRPEPAPGRRAFVSAQLFSVGGGVQAADAHCMAEASLGGLTGEFRALLGTSTASAASRFDLSGPPWVRVDGIELADSPLAFMTGTLHTSLGVDQLKNPTARYVLTAGDPRQIPFYTCADWTSTANIVGVGDSSASTGELFEKDNASCTEALPLYCLER